MRKTFLAKRNALLSGKRITFGGVLLAFVFLFGALKMAAPDLFWHTFAPVTTLGSAFAGNVQAFSGGLGSATALASKNQALTKENMILATRNEALTAKLTSVTALLGATEAHKLPGVLAGVVTRPPESPYDSLTVAAGTKDGVTVGMEAFANGAVPIGVVSGVSNDFAHIALFSASDASTAGWVGASSTPLTIKGAGGGVFSASVPVSAKVAVGDVVSVPGPGQLPLGQVVRIDRNPLASVATLRIVPAVNLFSLSWVILRNTGGSPTAFATSTTL